MSSESRLVAGILLPTVVYGGDEHPHFLSVLSPDATEPNALIYLACAGRSRLRWGSWSWEPVLSDVLHLRSALQWSRMATR